MGLPLAKKGAVTKGGFSLGFSLQGKVLKFKKMRRYSSKGFFNWGLTNKVFKQGFFRIPHEGGYIHRGNNPPSRVWEEFHRLGEPILGGPTFGKEKAVLFRGETNLTKRGLTFFFGTPICGRFYPLFKRV